MTIAGIQHGARPTNCRRSLLAVLWLHMGCRELASGDEGYPLDAAGLRAVLEAERAKTAELESQLKEARGRTALLQALLDSAIQPAAADYADPARRISQFAAKRTALASCPLTPIVNQSLPRGSYVNSCNNCYRFGDSLRCSCFTQSQASHLAPRCSYA